MVKKFILHPHARLAMKKDRNHYLECWLSALCCLVSKQAFLITIKRNRCHVKWSAFSLKIIWFTLYIIFSIALLQNIFNFLVEIDDSVFVWWYLTTHDNTFLIYCTSVEFEHQLIVKILSERIVSLFSHYCYISRAPENPPNNGNWRVSIANWIGCMGWEHCLGRIQVRGENNPDTTVE